MTRSTPLDINWEPDRSSGEPITEQIVGFMCARISSGDWPIGSRLPSQRVLAERFGVNRSTIIAAISPTTASSKAVTAPARASPATRGR